MLNGTFYLNNSGSRWTHIVNGKRDSITLETKLGKQITRQVEYYESFGNFAVYAISYKGKRRKVFADTILED